MQRIHFREILIVLVTLLGIASLSACGQKGDLYHPEDKQAAVTDVHPYT